MTEAKRPSDLDATEGDLIKGVIEGEVSPQAFREEIIEPQQAKLDLHELVDPPKPDQPFKSANQVAKDRLADVEQVVKTAEDHP